MLSFSPPLRLRLLASASSPSALRLRLFAFGSSPSALRLRLFAFGSSPPREILIWGFSGGRAQSSITWWPRARGSSGGKGEKGEKGEVVASRARIVPPRSEWRLPARRGGLARADCPVGRVRRVRRRRWWPRARGSSSTPAANRYCVPNGAKIRTNRGNVSDSPGRLKPVL